MLRRRRCGNLLLATGVIEQATRSRHSDIPCDLNICLSLPPQRWSGYRQLRCVCCLRIPREVQAVREAHGAPAPLGQKQHGSHGSHTSGRLPAYSASPVTTQLTGCGPHLRARGLLKPVSAISISMYWSAAVCHGTEAELLIVAVSPEAVIALSPAACQPQ